MMKDLKRELDAGLNMPALKLESSIIKTLFFFYCRDAAKLIKTFSIGRLLQLITFMHSINTNLINHHHAE